MQPVCCAFGMLPTAQLTQLLPFCQVVPVQAMQPVVCALEIEPALHADNHSIQCQAALMCEAHKSKS